MVGATRPYDRTDLDVHYQHSWIEDSLSVFLNSTQPQTMWSFFLLTLLLAAVPLVSAEDHHQVLLWPEGRVCYHINTSSLPLARVAVIEQALRHVEQRTNLTFCAVSSECGDCPAFVHFEAKDGCWSYLGRQDPARLETSPLRPYTGQTLSVGVQCTFGHVLHELGHSLGLRHTHSRPDRDRYVRVFRENVEVPAVDDFEKVPTMPIFGAYDYHSIMVRRRRSSSVWQLMIDRK